MDKDQEIVENLIENEIKIPTVSEVHPKDKYMQYNAKLDVIREAVLCSLAVQSQSSTEGRTETDSETSPQLNCLDGAGAPGIAGLQWKKHLADDIHVTVADRDNCIEIERCCDVNGTLHSRLQLDYTRVPGEPLPIQSKEEVHICQCPVNVALQLEAFDFVYLNPFGNLSNHLDSLFINLRNNGLACLVSADISAQFARSSQSVLRHYHAHVMKTDYMREMAARVIIAAAARSAARCNKGIRVLYTMCHEDFFLIVLQIIRGPKHAESCMHQCRLILHCQICEERVIYPDEHTPLENPYKLLSCNCKSTTPGRTGMELGPMWCGEIFDKDFLNKLMMVSKSRDKKVKLQILIESMLNEADCKNSLGMKDESEAKTENGDLVKDNGEPATKRLKTERPSQEDQQTPPFYYNLHRRKFKGVRLPKSAGLVTLLREYGYRASRTHFDANAIRTSASLETVYQLLQKHFKCKKN